jgi:pyruvate dehydrogenase E2 component (dihydrolipoamide acetyltransferase)
MATVEQKVPDLGDFKDVAVIELLVKPGDRVQAEQGLLLLESEKATMEVPASQAGKVVELKVKVGGKVSAGDVIALIETSAPSAAMGEGKDGGESKALSPPPQPSPTQGEKDRSQTLPSATASPVSPAQPIAATPGSVHASPAVRLFARELGVDLTRVAGSGPKGRILKGDVQAHVKKVMAGAQLAAPGGAGLPQMPAIDFSKFGPVEHKPLSRIRKLSATNLHRSWVLVPHVTQFDEADITELDAFRKESSEDAKKKGIKLTMLAFLLKASAKTLLEFPELCASLAPDGENLVLKKYVHIGVAVDTANGLVVPVIRDVDKKGIFQLAEELALVSEKARTGRLSPPDLQGGCFSISSLGGIGGTKFTPIVNAPEVAILGVSKAQMRPVWDGKGFVPRLILPLSLSYDHRVIDGAQAARVTSYLAELLGDIRRLLL